LLNQGHAGKDQKGKTLRVEAILQPHLNIYCHRRTREEEEERDRERERAKKDETWHLAQKNVLSERASIGYSISHKSTRILPRRGDEELC
jgi:hypothetical protein